MSLRIRFAIGMAAMLLPLVLAVAVGRLYLLPRLTQSLDDVVEEAIDEVQPIMDLQIVLLKAAMPANDYLIHGDPAERENFARLSQEVDQAFEEALAAPYALEEEQALVQTAWEEWRQARLLSEAILAIPVPVGDSMAAQAMERLDAHVDRAVDSLERLHGLAHQEVDEQLTAAQVDRRRVELLTLGAVGMALGIAVAASLALAHSVLVPIGAIRKATVRFGGGDLAYRLALARRDELGQLARAFNAMADKIAESQTALEAERAAEARRAQEAETLRQAGAAVAASLQPEEAIERILLQLERVVPYDSASVQLWTEDPERPGEGVLEIVGGRGWPNPAAALGLHFRVPGDNPNTVVIQQRRPHILTDAPSAYALFREAPHSRIRSWLGVPLIVGERLIGLLAVDGARPDSFTPDHVHLVSTFAAQVVIALENARLHAEAQRRARRQEALVRLSAELMTPLDEAEVCRRVVNGLREVLGYTHAGLFLVDEATGERVLPEGASIGWPDAPTHWRIPSGHGLSERPLLDGQLHYTPDVTRDSRYLHGVGTGAEVDVPVWIGEKVIGVLVAESAQPHAFNQDDFGVLTAAANQAGSAISRARLFTEIQGRADELAMLARVGEALNRAQSADETLRRVLAEAVKLVNREQGSVILVEPETAALRIFVSVSLPPEEVRAFNARRLRADEGTFANSIGRGEMVEVNDTAADPRVVRDYTNTFTEQLTNVPLKTAHGVIGVIALDGLPRDDRARGLLRALADLAAVAIEKAQLFEQVHRLAITDALTGLHNRRHFFEQAEREFERAQRYGRPLCALMLDIDRFKQVNDTYGHAVGDQVLRTVAARCQENLREIDLVGRYGGEEFAVLLPESDLNSARNAAERLRWCVAEASVETGRGPLTVTITLGVSTMTEDCADLAVLLDRADTAMYAAKKAGRNRVG